MFNYNHLHYFYITASQSSITVAAKILKISQPSLSQQLKQLEISLERKLFQKSGRGIELTIDGEHIFVLCQKMFSAANDIEVFLQGHHHNTNKKIRIGVSLQIEDLFVADLISLMHMHSSDVVIQVTSGTQQELMEKLRATDIDLMLTNTSVFGLEFVDKLEVDMPIGLFAATDKSTEIVSEMPINTASVRASLQKILRDPRSLGLVLPSESLRLRFETDLFLQKFDVHARIAIESDVLSVLHRAVVDGLGMAFLPLPYIHDDLVRGHVVCLNANMALWTHKLYFVGCRNRRVLKGSGWGSERDMATMFTSIRKAMDVLNQFVPASAPVENRF